MTIVNNTHRIGERANAREIGHKGHDTFEWSACCRCGKLRWVIVCHSVISSLYCPKCAQIKRAETLVGENHYAWKGGKRITNGYVLLYLPKGHKFESMRNKSTMYVSEHRLVMAEHLGRPLTSQELVHHKDGVRSNNTIENLELTFRGEHEKNHSKGYQDGFNKGYIDGMNKAKKEEI